MGYAPFVLDVRPGVRSSRNPLNTTITVLPSWPTTPSGKGMPRVSAAVTRVTITAREKAKVVAEVAKTASFRLRSTDSARVAVKGLDT